MRWSLYSLRVFGLNGATAHADAATGVRPPNQSPAQSTAPMPALAPRRQRLAPTISRLKATAKAPQRMRPKLLPRPACTGLPACQRRHALVAASAPRPQQVQGERTRMHALCTGLCVCMGHTAVHGSFTWPRCACAACSRRWGGATALHSADVPPPLL